MPSASAAADAGVTGNSAPGGVKGERLGPGAGVAERHACDANAGDAERAEDEEGG